MKQFTKIALIGLILAVAVVGCRKRPGYLTPLPGRNATVVQDPNASSGMPLDGSQIGSVPSADADATSGIPQPDTGAHDGWVQNAEMFKDQTVYFALDSYAVQGSERAKIAAVADYLKANTNPRTAVRIEGHCDERGTEEYNRALGERRAIAIREELVSAGIDPNRVETVSFGEDRPAVPGQDESAWRQNRRGEFILLTEP